MPQSEANESTGPPETNTSRNLPAALDPFPCLNTSGLSANEKVALYERLLHESLTLRLAFASLVSNAETSLIQQEISITEVHDKLKDSKYSHHKAIAEVSSIEEVFGSLGEYWGVCDYTILEHLILKFGTYTDRECLNKYQETFVEFAARRVFECPARMFGTSLGEEEVAVTVKRMDERTILYDTTLNHVRTFSSVLKRVLDIDGSDMRLITYHKDGNSLELEFGMLVSMAETAFPLSTEKKEELVSLGVWLVSCGDCVFQQQLYVSWCLLLSEFESAIHNCPDSFSTAD